MTHHSSLKFVCIHGHFYQPPRENPWLEDVEVQDSAHPYHDWNERVAFECYAPNTASRVLDAAGRISDIVNNYRLINFNFGPTLLSWMEHRLPDVYAKILEADRLSIAERSGHGNAMAQVYNHIIMPLASLRDKITQVRWGLADFERRFGRKAEGMWLAETAVDTETLEVLADHGIKFTVLAPSQAARIRPTGGGDWTDVQVGRVDPSRAYRWTSPSGKSLALFFYDSPISHAVAFEGILNSGEAFAARILQGFSPDRPHAQLVHMATDGESYGHHHRFGDMALASALRKIQADGHATLTNYGEFLEKFPPEWEAEIVERSSWSCAHGVERWNSDCGCQMGGHNPPWSQKWRRPLRAALDGLRDGLDALYENQAKPALKDPWAARDAYISVVLDRSAGSVDAFFKDQQARPLSPEERVPVLKWLEAQRQRMLMFTSCAWFFDEISGTEGVTILCFAARAIQLVRGQPEGPPLEKAFLDALSRAPSNLPEIANGAEVFRRYVVPVITDLPRVAAHEAIETLFNEDKDGRERTLYCYSVTSLDRKRVSSNGNVLTAGRLRVTSLLTGEAFEAAYAALHMGGHDVHCVLKPSADPVRQAEVQESLLARFTRGSLAEVLALLYRSFEEPVYSLQDLLLEARRRLLGVLIRDVVGRYDPIYRALVEENNKLIHMMREVDMPVPEAFRLALQYVFGRDLDLCMERLHRDHMPDGATARRLSELREESARFGLPLDWDQAARLLRHRLENMMADLQRGFDREAVRRIIHLLDLGVRLDLSMNLWRLENIFFELARGPFKDLEGEDRIAFSDLGARLRFPPLEQPAVRIASS